MKMQRVLNVLSPQMPETSRKKIAMIGFVFSLMAFTLPTTGWSGDTSRFKGPTAFATFSNTDGCISTYAQVSASDGVSHEPPGAPTSAEFSSAYISIYQYDECNFTFLVNAQSPPNTIADTDFQVTKNFNTASLKTTVNVYDAVTGSYFDVIVDLAWTATGDPPFRETLFLQDKSNGFIFTQKTTSTTRAAEVGGTVYLGTTNYSPNPATYGSIQNVTIGSSWSTFFK